ncbi:hypothetical protein HYC85_021286 [Camellia sinensis]|uniref:GST N-terminal domain-containing protein n=1 Tax=Camellia sinensis TaxID=4442 RepID=A0A7J7GH80_CAMSI|nr:hypothetical protein HYC85_021286 [Camellia sinensis]
MFHFYFLKVVHLLHLSVCAACLDCTELQGCVKFYGYFFCSTISFLFSFIHVTAILNLKFLYFFVRGLQEKIKLVPIDLQNRPDWYKEKVYPPNKVPSLEHNNEIRGESLDLLKYIDSYFEGPALYPDDPTKREFAEELLSYTNTFNLVVITSLKGGSENEISTAFDYLESALLKFTDGPFFHWSVQSSKLVDITYAPFIERFYPLLLDVKKYDITTGRPMLTSWIEVHYLSLPFCAKLLLCGCQPTSNSNSNC